MSSDVVHLAFGNLTSGAGKGALILHRGLFEEGVDSRILCSHAPPGGPERNIQPFLQWKWQKGVHRCLNWLQFQSCRTLRGQRVPLFSSGTLGWPVWRHPWVKEADILHLHWVNGGFLSTRGIGRLGALGKPIVWTLRDMWPFTGGCHYSLACERYEVGCGKCPLFGGRWANDRTRRYFRAKRSAFSKIEKLFPVGISPWIAGEAARSPIFAGRDVKWIWNGVDLSEFPLVDKVSARREMGLDPDRGYFVLGAVDQSYAYKGYQKLRSAVERFYRESGDRERSPGLLVFGRGGEDLKSMAPDVRHFGVIRDNHMLNRVYAAADGFLMPSLQEAFGKTIVESLASGTPVVCFDNSGPRDMVVHRMNAYKAEAFDVKDFVQGMHWCLATEADRATRCADSVKPFSHLASAAEYHNLYREIFEE